MKRADTMRRGPAPTLCCALSTALWLTAIWGCGGQDPAAPPDEGRTGTARQAVETFEVKCWNATLYDRDADGYADRFAQDGWRVTFNQPSDQSMSCPAGYVMARGDCDDSDATVHPRRREVHGNGVDDNCDGRIDEPTFDYHYRGFNNTTTGFTMRVRVHDAAVVSAHLSSWRRLYYEVEYQRLSATATTHTTGRRLLDALTPMGSHYRAEIRLDGLSPTTVYRARVRFFWAPVLLGPSLSKTAIKTVAVGEVSDWYYTTTTGTAAVSVARTEVVLRGLYEYFLNVQLGFTGYEGLTYVDGTRYGADQDEWWCSEFYSWAADHALSIGHQSSVSKMRRYFRDHSAYRALVTTAVHHGVPDGTFDGDKYNMHRGDYLALDTNADREPNHSAMVLDYDADQGVLRTLEGNTGGFTDIGDGFDSRRAGNETMVRTRSGTQVHGWGSIRSSMLD